MVEKVVKTNFFHDLGLQNSLRFHFFHKFLRKSLESYKWWKKLSKTIFSTQAVLEAQIVEKIVFDNFFHFFHEF